MGCEEDAEELRGTQRPMGLTVVTMVATLVLLSAPAGTALDSQHHICPIHKNSIKLFPYEKAFFGTNSQKMSVSVEAVGCFNVTRVLRLWKLTVSNATSRSEENFKWYEFISCGNYMGTVGSEIVKFRPEIISPECFMKPITLSVKPTVLLGRKCTESARGREVQKNKDECKGLEGVPDTGRRLIKKPTQSSIKKLFEILNREKDYDAVLSAGNSNDGKNIFDTPRFLFDDQQKHKESEVDKSDTSLNWPYDILPATPASQPTYDGDKINYFDSDSGQPTYDGDKNNYFNSDSGFIHRRNYKENAIPIFIGIILLTLTMCLRFCLWRGKSVVQRVTTVTVIRSRPVGPDMSQDQQDPPPSYIDVVNEATSPQSPANEDSVEPPPPAYADIVDEGQPPTYSEVEAQSMPPSEEAPLAEEAEAHTTQPPSNPESVQDDKGSAPSKNMLSKYRSQQKQFAFKVLEEDE